ncbi:MAG: DUF177 domain-containing protein [Rikenellaceae bacterium]
MEGLTNCVIAYKSLGVGAFDYSIVVDSEFFNRFETSEISAGNCSVDVQLQRGETMLELDVKIAGEVVVECDRCLEDCPVSIDYQGSLIVKFSSEVSDYDGDILWLSPQETQVDLSQYIYESIVLSLPYQRVHEPGECNPAMIEKFAIISGAEFDAMDDSEEEEEELHGLASGDLAKLQALKEMMEEEKQ